MKSIEIKQHSINIDRTKILKAISSRNCASHYLLDRLSKNQDYLVRLSVADNHNTAISLLSKLIRDSHQSVRRTAIKNYLKKYPQGLSEILKIYSNKSQLNIVRLLVLLHPQVSEKILIKHSRSLFWLERYAIAINPNTPHNIRQQLSQDSNSIVRAAITSLN